MLHDWQMVQSLLNQQADNAIGVENEVCSIGVLISNHTAVQEHQQDLTAKEQLGAETHVKRAISCGV